MRIGRKLLSNTIYLFFNWFSITFLSFLYWLIIGKTLSPSSYGIVATSLQIATIVSGLALVGIKGPITKLIPEFLVEKKKKAHIQGLINYSFKLVFKTVIIFSSLTLMLLFILSHMIKLPSNTFLLIFILIITMSFALLTRFIYYGFQNMRELFMTNLAGQITKVAIAGILIFLGMNYLGPLFGILLGYLFAFLLRVRKYFKVSLVSRLNKKLVWEYSLPAFIVSILTLIFTQTQLILLTTFKNVRVSGLFALAGRIASVIPVIPTILTQALFPITSALSAKKKGKVKQRYLIKLIFRYVLFFTLPLVFSWIFFAKYLILIFAQPIYLPATQLLPLLAISGIFFGLAHLFLSSLYAIGKPKHYRNSYIIAVIIYLMLAIPLTYYYSAYGMALAVIISNFTLFLLTFFSLRKFLKIEIEWKDVARIGFSATISFLFLLLIKPYVYNFYVAFIVVMLAAILYLSLLLKMNFYLKEDLRILIFLYNKTRLQFMSKFIDWFKKYAKRSYF